MGVHYPAFVNPAVRADRRRWMSLDGMWQFRIDPDERGAREGWAGGHEEFPIPIRVPGAVWAMRELADAYPSYRQPNSYEGSCWYQRRFHLDDKWKDGKLWLKFGGVLPAAHVWLNGVHLGYHRHAVVGFKCDATGPARHGDDNVLTLELPWHDLEMRGGLVQAGPGVCCGVELEQTGQVRIEDLFVRPRIDEGEAWITAVLHNDTGQRREVRIRAQVCPRTTKDGQAQAQADPLSLDPGASSEVSLKVKMGGYQPWTPDTPFLYVATLEALRDGDVVDAVAERFGMRRMCVEDGRLVLNHKPLMWRAVADELEGCPTIAPLVDREIIRRRISALKDAGFNGKRHHTHVPTREELDVCDEMGFLLQVEPSVVSNFYEIKPYPANRESLVSKIKEVRTHASVVVFCLGNENSQLMHQEAYKERAKVHWADARGLAPDHLFLTGCGYQGEYPDVRNDFQTPHLWSQAWKWAHEGLSSVPWAALARLTSEGPIVIHEYGKMTIWPDPAEDEIFREAGLPLRGNYGQMGRIALEEAGLAELLSDVVQNSRKLAAVCTKTVIEQARRQRGVCGYQYISAFRIDGSRGFIDDLGRHTDPQFSDIRLSNGDTALLMDRDFRCRTLTAGEPVELGVYLSHFGQSAIEGGALSWTIVGDGGTLSSGRATDLSFPQGLNAVLHEAQFVTPDGLGRFRLQMNLELAGRQVAANQWDFWRFPHPRRASLDHVVIRASDKLWEKDIRTHFPSLHRYDDFVAALFGIRRTPIGDSEKLQALATAGVKAIVADAWTPPLIDFAQGGGTVLLLDRGSLPMRWYVPASEEDGEHDIYKLYAPFRTGWDHGNAATVVHNHPAMGDFPHEGWCDLHFFDMIQGATSLKTAQLPGAPAAIIRVIPMWRTTGDQAGPAPEYPDVARPWATEDRCYLAESRVGKGRIVVCSLRVFAEPAGRYLLDCLLDYVNTIGEET